MQVLFGRRKTAQQDISDLQQEISAVRQTLRHQLITLNQLYTKVEEQSRGWSKLSKSVRNSNSVSRVEISSLLECIEHVEHRINVLSGVSIQSDKFEGWLQKQNAMTKNQQQNAIYAFTIVTVVFLPLSFVYSFLGMNTVGIRDMGNGQWVFWVSAIPITLVVILLALFLTDELGHAWTAIRQIFASQDEYWSFENRDRDRWKVYKDGGADLRNISKRNKSPKQQQPLIIVNEAAPTTQVEVEDEWNRPYRRTQTFRSI